MQMKIFEAAYSGVIENPEVQSSDEGLKVTQVRRLIREHGGTSYEGGLYRIFNAEDAKRWTIMVRRLFPIESAEVEAFGRDWQGNVFGYREGRAPRVFLFQPGTGDVFEVSDSLERFHNEELTEHAEEALSLSLWNEWRSDLPGPDRSQCVGYRKPVFLDGDVSVDNLVMADLDVYWDVMGQLLEQVRNLPEGTPIKEINLAYLN
ncbi:MAG: DUF1851 domain-containing protein [Acidobacteriaceae bacterium]|jgi:hypothetical protein|nr:DUF1851 domain-containing protein [Acidobacteriaceae bacterium]